MKFDINDYFMSGEQPGLCPFCVKHVAEQRKVVFGKFLHYVLDNQYVELVKGSTIIWKAVKGSRIGLGELIGLGISLKNFRHLIRPMLVKHVVHLLHLNFLHLLKGCQSHLRPHTPTQNILSLCTRKGPS